jgi:hypothetical protein
VVLWCAAQTYDLQKRYAAQEQVHTEVHFQADLQVRQRRRVSSVKDECSLSMSRAVRRKRRRAGAWSATGGSAR